MRATLRFLLSLTVALLLMLLCRALAFTIYTVEGDGLSPVFQKGDHVMVNRWSYGLRTGTSDGLFTYGRLMRSTVKRGDIVAFEDPTDPTRNRIMFGRCRALPGDTICYNGRLELVPSLKNCDSADHYWIQALGENNPTDSRQLGYISEQSIIGRAIIVVYNHDPQAPFWAGYNGRRILLKK